MRRETRGDIVAAVAHAFEGGIDDINLDLMFAFPGERGFVVDSVAEAVAAGVGHISVYPYFPAPNTKMFASLALGLSELPHWEAVFSAYMKASVELAKHGFEEYIFSLFARPGRQSEYDVCSFNLSDELDGFGVGAHSMRDGRRWRETYQISAHSSGEFGGHEATPEDLWTFPVIKMLRTDAGIDLQTILYRAGRSLDELRSANPRLDRVISALETYEGVVREEQGYRFRNAIDRARFYCRLPQILMDSYT